MSTDGDGDDDSGVELFMNETDLDPISLLESQQELQVNRYPGGSGVIESIDSSRDDEPILWLDLVYHYATETENPANSFINLRLMQLPFLSGGPMRFAVDDREYLSDSAAQRFVQPVRRVLHDDRLIDPRIGVNLRPIGDPSKTPEGTYQSMAGVMMVRDPDEQEKWNVLPMTRVWDALDPEDADDRETDYEDDYMFVMTVAMLNGAKLPHNMDVIRNDLRQLGMYDPASMSRVVHRAYRIVVSVNQKTIIGNFRYEIVAIQGAMGFQGEQEVRTMLPTDPLPKLPPGNPDYNNLHDNKTDPRSQQQPKEGGAELHHRSMLPSPRRVALARGGEGRKRETLRHRLDHLEGFKRTKIRGLSPQIPFGSPEEGVRLTPPPRKTV